jgi:glycosyltransferase involved in cell wall biosynthesis
MNLPERLREYVRPVYLRWFYFRVAPNRRPQAFSACWHYSFEKLPLQPPSASSPQRSRAILFYPMNDWHTRVQRTHHLAREMVRRGYRVGYINPHLGREYDTVPFLDSAGRLARLEPDLYEVHVRLPREPVFHHRVLEAAESKIISRTVERALVAMEAEPAAQVLSFPIWVDAAQQIRRQYGCPIIYDCHDLLSGFGRIAPEIVAQEEDAMRAADVVLFSASGLLEEHCSREPELRRKSKLLRNAVGIDFFHVRPDSPPNAAVYAGALESWFDADAVHSAAVQNPNCRFLLAGPMDSPHLRALQALPNVEFMGELRYPQIPEFLARGRVGLIPFFVNRLTLATNPIKLYEYFAFGMPVVSAPLPEVEAFGDLVYIARGPAEFAAAVKCALEEDDPARRERRRQTAQRENWAARASQIESLIASRSPLLDG